MPDVFISYKREERERCVEIYDRLVALKLDVWFDARLEPGTRFDDEIENAIRASRAVLVLWSPEAARSEWIRNEATVGRTRKILSSAFIRPTELPIAFLSTQTEDLTREHFPDDWPGWLGTLRRIGSLVGRPGLEAYSRLLAKPEAQALKGWVEQWPHDPLVAEAWRLAESIEIEATRARLTLERASAARSAAPRPDVAVVPQSAAPDVAASPAGAPAGTSRRGALWPLALIAAGGGALVWVAVALQRPDDAAGTSPPVAAAPASDPARGDLPAQPGAAAASPAAASAGEAAAPPLPLPESDRAASIADARRALDAITLRDWGVLDGSALIGRVTKVAPFDAIEALAAQRDARAQLLLGYATELGLNSVERNRAEALRLYRLAAAQGNSTAQAHLGFKFSEGADGLTRDDVAAARLFRQSASQGNALGQVNLGYLYATGRGGLREDAQEAQRLYRLAADQGNPTAQSNLGSFYRDALGGLAKNDAEAVRLFRLAADQGNAFGQINLGFAHQQGIGGLPKNERQAQRLYRLAAEQGNAFGQANLGVFYRDARGGLVQNDVEAVRLFRLAAAQGEASGQAHLGNMYDNGRGGLTQDHAQAVRLYRLAARQGYEWARDELRRLNEAE